MYVATAETDASCIGYLETTQAAPRGAKPSLFTQGSSEVPAKCDAVLVRRLGAAASL